MLVRQPLQVVATVVTTTVTVEVVRHGVGDSAKLDACNRDSLNARVFWKCCGRNSP